MSRAKAPSGNRRGFCFLENLAVSHSRSSIQQNQNFIAFQAHRHQTGLTSPVAALALGIAEWVEFEVDRLWSLAPPLD